MIFNRLQTEKDIQCTLNREKVYTRLGYKENVTELPLKMIDLVEKTITEALPVMAAAGVHMAREIEDKGERISLYGTNTFLEGISVKNLLKNSFAVFFLAVTIGEGLEKLIARYSEEEQFEKALILDAIGSEGVEAIAGDLNHHLQILARQSKLVLTRRFSPGYGDLPLQFQAQLYEELSLSSLGISIDDRYILWPKKTVTALIGIER